MPRRKRDESSSEDSSDSDDSSYDSGSSSSGSSGSSSSSDSSESDSSSDSDANDVELIQKLLKDAGLKKYIPKLKRLKTLKQAKALNDKSLTKYGVQSASDRKKIIAAFNGEDSDESSSEYESSSDNSDEEDQIHQMLRQMELKQYVTNFKRNRIDTMEKAYKLDDRKMRKMGIDVSAHRKKIKAKLQKKKKSKDSSEDENDESKIARILRGIELEDHVKDLQKAKVLDMESAYKLDEKKLKRAGITEGSARRKIVRAFKKYKEAHEDDVDIGASTIQKLLAKVGMKKHYSAFKKKEIDTVAKAKALEHKDLREMGISLYKERRDILEAFERYKGGEVSSASSSSAELEMESNPVHDVLRQQYMSRHISDFDQANITTIRAARRLTQTQLRSMGVALYLQREKLIEGFRDYKPKNKAIMRILIDTNLARHASEFEKLIDIEDAKNLTHADLRSMGISLYGQRDRLMKAFAAYEPKKRKGSDSDSSGSDSSSSDEGELNPVESVLVDQHLHRFISSFNGVKSIEQARALTHSQLRNRGLKLFGQRERVMKAFEEYEKPKKKKKKK